MSAGFGALIIIDLGYIRSSLLDVPVQIDLPSLCRYNMAKESNRHDVLSRSCFLYFLERAWTGTRTDVTHTDP